MRESKIVDELNRLRERQKIEKEAFSIFSIFVAFSTIVWHIRSHSIDSFHTNRPYKSWQALECKTPRFTHISYASFFLSGSFHVSQTIRFVWRSSYDLTEFPWTTVSHTNLSFKTVNGCFFSSFFFFIRSKFKICWGEMCVCVCLLNSFLLLVVVVVVFFNSISFLFDPQVPSLARFNVAKWMKFVKQKSTRFSLSLSPSSEFRFSAF